VSGAAAIEARVRAGGLLAEPVLVLLSGGQDSVCLLDLAARMAPAVRALHVDYGLRVASEADAEHCAALCERLGVPLTVHRPGPPEGNLQAWARAVRYAEADRAAGGALVATGHTATDQVETVLYRLAASPGRRALLGMRDRDGRLVRPLLALPREDTAAYCAERGLPWREDVSNATPAFARNRLRHGLLPALRELHPAAEANLLSTLGVLRDEAAVLDAVVGELLAGAGDPPATAVLAAQPPALRRLAVQALAGEGAPALGPRADEILALGGRGGSAALDLGGGLRAVVEYGRLRFDRGEAPAAPPGATVLPAAGETRFGAGSLIVEHGPDLPVGDGVLDAATCAEPGLSVRPWRDGDRMRPLGVGGSRSLQDLFTDRKVPRARRRAWPVVVCGEEIAWVPAVATGERFRVTPATRERVRLSWRPKF
jgi:tRNA(Ile)-lysidine synthase